MKRIFTLIIIASGIAIQAAALDFGVNLSNITGLNGTDDIAFNISQANSAKAFVEFSIKGFSSVYISGEARFSGLFHIKPKESRLIPITQAFRLTRTDWSGNTAFNTIGLQWVVGRTVFSEYSGKVLNGLFDGARLGITVKNTDIAFAVGYTGLTYKNDAKIKMDQDDRAGMNDTGKILAPQRLFLLLTPSFQEVIPSHTFGIDILAQFDLLEQTEQTHTQYLIPYIHGRLGRNVTWKYWGAVQLGEDTQFFYSLASGLSMQYFNPDWRFFTLTGKIDWAAGDYDDTGVMRSFIPITGIKQTVVADESIGRFSDRLTAGITAGIRPIQALLTELSYVLLASPNTAKAPAYTGSELSAKITYHFYNDFSAAFIGGIFVPNRGVDHAYNLQWLTDLTFTVKL